MTKIVDQTSESSIRSSFEYKHSKLKKLLISLFNKFNEDNLPYIVLRNYEEFPNRLHKPDIGLLIAAGAENELVESTLKVCKSLDLNILIKPSSTNIISILVLSNETTTVPSLVVKIDARTYEVFKTNTWMKAIPGFNYKVYFSEFNRELIKQGTCSFFVPDDRDQLILSIKQWQRKQDLRYLDTISKLLQTADLKEWFNSATRRLDCDNLIKQPRSKSFDNMLYQVTESRWGDFGGKRLLVTLWVTFQSWCKRKVRYFPSIFYFSGPDGAGKTACLEDTKTLLQGYHVKYKYFYTLHKILRHIGMRMLWVKHLIPGNKYDYMPFKDFLGRGQGHHDRNTGTSAWRLKKRIGLVFSFFDVWMGWILAFFWRLRGYHILVETSPYDLFTKYHMPSFPVLEKILARWIPKPCQGFLLKASPECITARKPELTETEIAGYYVKFKNIIRLSGVQTYAIVSTEISPEETRVTIRKLVLNTINTLKAG